jgi:hypothetical protein
MKIGLFISCILLSITSFGQYLNKTNIEVKENGISFPDPWTGGLNAAQFSSIDLDLDGTLDLFAFDRTGNRQLPFLWDGNKHVYAPEYIDAFPPMEQWALLLDYNCDGKADIFNYSFAGFSVYKNVSTTSLAFELVTERQEAAYYVDLIGNPVTPPDTSSIYVSKVDLPAFADIDEDGDIDLLTFTSFGGYIEYYQNQSMELYGNCDSLVFHMIDHCWGDFYEGLNTYDLNNCPTPLVAAKMTHGAHTGSSLLAIDLDGDQDKEIILGDVSFDNLTMLYNGGTLQDALMDSVDASFPANNSNTIGASFSTFPAAFYVDVNNDNLKDLIVAPNQESNTEDASSNWLYLNNGSNSVPDFQFVKENFLQDSTLDFGSGAYPIPFDYNNDGLLDLLVGGLGEYNSGDHLGKLALLENTGTANNPSFDLVDRDFGGLSTIPLNTILNTPVAGLSPTVGDLDNDGDEDLIVGDADGKLHYFENTAASGSNAQFSLHTPNYFNIDVGQFAAPALYDLNQDNLLDLVVGYLNGKLYYAPNNGSATTAVFDTLIANFGSVVTSNYFGGYGYSRPFFYEENGSTQLLVGSESGQIFHYNDIDNNLNGNFNLLDTAFHQLHEGIKVSPCFADFNNDGMKDLFVGNECGGLLYFQNDTASEDTSSISIHTPTELSLSIYPNPAKEQVVFQSIAGGVIHYSLHNALGQELSSAQFEERLQLSTQHYPRGLYFVRFHSPKQAPKVQRLLLQ